MKNHGSIPLVTDICFSVGWLYGTIVEQGNDSQIMDCPVETSTDCSMEEETLYRQKVFEGQAGN